MQLTGHFFIGSTRVQTRDTFQAVAPATSENLAPKFSTASTEHIDQACALAQAAFVEMSALGANKRANLLDKIADEIMALGDALLDRAHAESGLPVARVTGERGRTVGQLKLFANEVRDGGWMSIRIDPAQPDRAPLPRSDLRMINKALGPVAVFGASNFPLAFSVAGGDTASALAAGCPVVVKGHPAHPGTSEMIASAIIKAVKETGFPDGTFSLLNGTSYELGQSLVSHPAIKAVGFTGSRQGGLALMQTAAARDVPVPVYAEMSAVNPVVLLPEALSATPEKLGQDFIGSLTMGAGQFCTNPGLIFAIEGPALDKFLAAAKSALAESAPQVMLTSGIHAAYIDGVERVSGLSAISTAGRGPEANTCNTAQGVLFEATSSALSDAPEVTHEVFGPSSVLIRCADETSLLAALADLEGQLTATLHLVDGDMPLATKVLPLLEEKAGRILCNGWPTGVEVCNAMVHGGPFPATSDGRSTSVGTLAIQRFLRPVCYQDIPTSLLPEELREQGRVGTNKRIDGKWTQD